MTGNELWHHMNNDEQNNFREFTNFLKSLIAIRYKNYGVYKEDNVINDKARKTKIKIIEEYLASETDIIDSLERCGIYIKEGKIKELKANIRSCLLCCDSCDVCFDKEVEELDMFSSCLIGVIAELF